jgi:hypothetical protein
MNAYIYTYTYIHDMLLPYVRQNHSPIKKVKIRIYHISNIQFVNFSKFLFFYLIILLIILSIKFCNFLILFLLFLVKYLGV